MVSRADFADRHDRVQTCDERAVVVDTVEAAVAVVEGNLELPRARHVRGHREAGKDSGGDHILRAVGLRRGAQVLVPQIPHARELKVAVPTTSS